MKRTLLLALLLPVAACGGGDSGSEKADYLGRAKAVCAQAKTERDALTTPTSPTAIAPYIEALVATARKASDGLQSLDEPEADAADLKTKLLDPLAKQVELGEAYAVKVKAAGGDQAALTKLLAEAPDVGAVDVDFVKAYGLGECAEAAGS